MRQNLTMLDRGLQNRGMGGTLSAWQWQAFADGEFFAWLNWHLGIEWTKYRKH